MKNLVYALTVTVISCCFVSCNEKQEPIDYVDVFVGTGGHGHTFPGATVPHGMVQLSPDTRIYDWDACSGYHFSDSTINGFSHTHVSGTGCSDYGDILIMPFTGDPDLKPHDGKSQQLSFASPFKRENEKARPGYYSVLLDRYNTLAELTTADRAGYHRYTYPKDVKQGVIVDLDYAIQGQNNTSVKLEILNDREIRGYKQTSWWAANQKIYFHLISSKPFEAVLYENDTLTHKQSIDSKSGKAVLFIKDQTADPLLLKVGISCVDYEGARLNLQEELENASFEETVTKAGNKWKSYLSVIDVEDTDTAQLKNFYTALYHTGIAPNIFSDADGRYRGMNDSILTTPVEDPVYTVFSLWDTFRAYHPLMTIIRPSQNEAYIRSLIKKAQEGGVFPMWEIAANYTGTMIGYHAVSLIADSYMKGYRNFDINEAYKHSLKIANYDTSKIHAHPLVVAELMPQAKYYKNKLGYIPSDMDNESVAKGLEYAYNDWCISLLAGELGDKENQEKYQRFAQGYKWYFDESTGFMRGLDSEGNWRVPFNPRASSHRNDDYCEGTAWQWTWFVPHDVDGLVALMGGKNKFEAKLDSLFTVESSLEGESTSMDISGLIGQYAHGNEPSHHIAHLYNYIGKPQRTQELLDSIIYSQYSPTPDGICGNEDCGQMSAWYIMNAMGIYQVAPGNPVYSIGRPIFDKMTVNMEGKLLTIETINNSRKNKYVKSVSFNGVKLTEPFITHDQLSQGGTLTFEMTDKPNQ